MWNVWFSEPHINTARLFTVHTYTHPFNGPFPGLPRWAGTRKVKSIWISLKQETVSGSGISWAIWYGLCLFVYKALHGLAPVYIKSMCASLVVYGKIIAALSVKGPPHRSTHSARVQQARLRIRRSGGLQQSAWHCAKCWIYRHFQKTT